MSVLKSCVCATQRRQKRNIYMVSLIYVFLMNALNLCTYLQEGLFFNALVEQKTIDAIIIDKPLPA